mmetsp:Transcript_96143/g.253900  ORF Transcript_96143/g.253900 Transcript_96143/m.253900 type:complete len:207 (-) Transcript_96143:74-694(-)
MSACQKFPENAIRAYGSLGMRSTHGGRGRDQYGAQTGGQHALWRVNTYSLAMPPCRNHHLSTSASPASTHLLGRGSIPAAALDVAQRLANGDRRIADDAARADQARDLFVARDGGRPGKAAHLALRLDAHSGRDAADRAAHAAERRRALLAAVLDLEAAHGLAGHAPHAPIPEEEAVVAAAAPVADHDRVVVEGVTVAAHGCLSDL